MNVIELDDRGYIYGQDRAGSGITVLQPTGQALQVVTDASGGGPGHACEGPAASHNPNCPGH